MDGKNNSLEKLLKYLIAYNDDALVVMANKGLLRRAYKDLEKAVISQVEIFETTQVKILIDDQEVILAPKDMNQSQCNCVASSTCRHILTAMLHLRQLKIANTKDQSDSNATATDSKQFILNLNQTDLEKWAGKKTTQNALSLALQSDNIEIDSENKLEVRFIKQAISCHFVSGTDLESVIVKGKNTQVKKFIVASVIAIQIAIGEESAFQSLVKNQQSKDGKQLVELGQVSIIAIIETQRLVTRLIDTGITHVSLALVQRMIAMGIVLQKAHLPRLAKLVVSCAGSLELLVRRHAQANEEEILINLAMIYALATAINTKPSVELVGSLRTAYKEGELLDLVCLGAYRWQTGSDYHGLSLMFWDKLNQRFLTWSDSRPISTDYSFDPYTRYLQTLPWKGGHSGNHMVGNRVALKRAKLNENNRLSSSEQTQATVEAIVEDAWIESIESGLIVYSDWELLQTYMNGLYPIGFESVKQTDYLVIVEPTSIGQTSYNEIAQTLECKLLDLKEYSILITIPYTQINELTLSHLEWFIDHFKFGMRLLGQLGLVDGVITLFPYSLFIPEKQTGYQIINMSLDKILKKQKKSWFQKLSTKLLSTQSEGKIIMDNYLPPQTNQLLISLESLLQKYADGGRYVNLSLLATEVEKISRNLERAGLLPLNKLCKEFLTESKLRAESLLQAKYACEIYRQVAQREHIRII